MTDREAQALEWEDQEGWDGLVRLFDDLVRDTWGGVEPEGEFPAAVDTTSGVYDSVHFLDIIKRTLSEVRETRSKQGRSPDRDQEIAVVATRIVDWERLRQFVGDGGRDEVCAWVAQQLETLLGPEDDIGRLRTDTFGILLRGRSPEDLPGFVEQCVEAVEAEPCDVYSAQVEVHLRAAAVGWEGEGADRLVERALRETSED
jgi:GGDEF domain-containing protein